MAHDTVTPRTFLRLVGVVVVATRLATCAAVAVDGSSPPKGETDLKSADALRAKIIQYLVSSGVPAKAVVGRTTR